MAAAAAAAAQRAIEMGKQAMQGVARGAMGMAGQVIYIGILLEIIARLYLF